MARAKFDWLSIKGICSMSFLILLTSFIPLLAFAQASDEVALRALTEQFFAAYEKKDLDGHMVLWSDKSPDLATSKKTIQQSFAAVSKIGLKDLSIRKVTVGGEKAAVRVVIEIDAVDLKTGKPAVGFGKLNRTLHWVKTEGSWKVWRYVPSEEDLAAAIVSAETAQERKRLLEADKELLTVDLIQTLLAQGRQLLSQANYPRALDTFMFAMGIAEQLSDKAGTATALRGIGVVHSSQSNYTQALQYYQKSLKISEETGDREGIARTLNNIGNVHTPHGNYAHALEHYQKSLKISEEVGDKAMIATRLNNIGIVHYLQGNYTQALEFYQKSLKISEEVGGKAMIATTLINIGNVHYSQGNYIQALEFYQKSLIISEEIGDKVEIANALNNIGTIHRSQGDYIRALEFYQKSLKIREGIGYKAGVAQILNKIGSVHDSQGNYTQSVEIANQAADIAKQIGYPDMLREARTTAGKAYRALNQPEQARQAFADAIAAVEELRARVAGGEQQQQRFFEDKISPYYAMADLLVEQNNFADALSYAERAKGRALLDVLRSGKVNISKAMTAAEQQQEHRLNAEIVSLNAQVYREKLRQQPDQSRLADLNARLQKVRLDYEAFHTNLYAAHPELKVQRGETQPLSLKEAAVLIPDNKTALLEFAVLEDKTYLFVLTRERSQGIRAGQSFTPSPDAQHQTPALKVYTLNIKQKDLADLAQRFRQRLANHDLSYQDLAAKLYDLLLKPARAQLLNKTTLVIVPDGVLWELPFQALQPTHNRHLIEDHSIYYAPSLTVLREMSRLRTNRAQSTTSPASLLAFGNPIIDKETSERVKSVFMDEKLLPLPEAERQVKMLGQMYGASRSKVYIGQDARESRAKSEAGKYQIMHLATHGILNDASPMYSQIVLSQAEEDKNEDGLLEAWEIMKLDLNADLVVLSACETARGRVSAGEGMIGLSWALFVAGCPTAVVSQWKVESVSTTELMVEFHRILKPRIENPKSKITKAEALRQAALKLLRSKEYRHPFYWAGFVVVGDGR